MLVITLRRKKSLDFLRNFNFATKNSKKFSVAWCTFWDRRKHFLKNWWTDHIHLFITQSIDRCMLIWREWWIHFLFCSVFAGENCISSSCFLFSTAWFWQNYIFNDFSLLDSLLRLVCLLMVHSYLIMIIDQQNLGTFSDDTCSSTTVFIFLHI